MRGDTRSLDNGSFGLGLRVAGDLRPRRFLQRSLEAERDASPEACFVKKPRVELLCEL